MDSPLSQITKITIKSIYANRSRFLRVLMLDRVNHPMRPIPQVGYIWVISPSHSKNLLALVKVQILKPSGRVLPKWLHLCPSGFRKFTCVSAQIQRNIFKTCLLDGSRSRQSWGIPNFHDFWAAPGAIWSHLDGSKQETV